MTLKHFPRTEKSRKMAQDLLTEMSKAGIDGRIPNTPAAAHLIAAVVEAVGDLPGSFAEIGVHKGQTAWFTKKCMEMTGQPDRTFYLHDTFEGMSDLEFARDDNKVHREQFKDTSEKEVKDLFAEDKNIKVITGVFPDTAVDDKYCYVHVDCDLYSSVKSCCEYFESRLVPFGVMIFDDWNSPTCHGATRAIQEWCKTNPSGKFFTPPDRGAFYVAGGTHGN